MKKQIAIIGTVGIPAKYGGFETLVEYLTRYLNTTFQFTVFCSAKAYKNKPETYNNAKLRYIPLQANGVQSIVYDIVCMFQALFFADTLLILGVSGCVVMPWLRWCTNKHLVVNIDGLEWKRQKWGKAAKWFLKYSERLAVKYAHEVVTDNKAIKDYVKLEYNVDSKLIAYGADHCQSVPMDKAIITEFQFLSEPYAFKVCRIEPENNIKLILSAFSKTRKFPLVLIGNWNNSDFGKEMKLEYQDFKNIHLLDPIYDQEKLNKIRSNCKFYVHGHSAGGTNPSLVEAMYLKLPILAYDVSYNKETTAYKADYFGNTSELIKVLNSVSDSRLKDNANAMFSIAKDRYTWKRIAEQYGQLF